MVLLKKGLYCITLHSGDKEANESCGKMENEVKESQWALESTLP